jgi:outer membrane protein assembly factor BamD (BamD/ComL family)
MRFRRILVVPAVLLACAAAARAGDILQRKDGSFLPPLKSGGETPQPADFDASPYQVVDADIDDIKCQMAMGKDKTVLQNQKATDFVEIHLEPKDIPPTWREAVDAMASGDYKGAIARFRAIAEEKRNNAVIRQKALLYAARAVAATGSTGEADAAYETLFKNFPKSFYTLAAWKDRSQMWMDAGDMAKAKAAAEQILKVPGASEGDRLEAQFLLTTVNFRIAASANPRDTAGIQKALNEYKAIDQQTARNKEQATVNALSRVGQANCLLELGQAGEAKGLFQEISDRATDKAVCAAAFNGLGECWYRENNFAEARRCFLRTVTLYAEGTAADQIAKALYYAGDCFNRLQDLEDWRDGARRELAECVRRFPTSPWADKAKRVLQGLK